MTIAQRYVDDAKVAAAIPDYGKTLALIKKAISLYEAAGTNSAKYPDDLVNEMYGIAATTLRGMGRDSEAIAYAEKPMMISQNAGAAALKVFSLLWQSNNAEASKILNTWFEPDPNNPAQPLKPRSSPLTFTNK